IKNPLTIILNSLHKYIAEHKKSEDLNKIMEHFNTLNDYIIKYMDSHDIEHATPEFDEFKAHGTKETGNTITDTHDDMNQESHQTQKEETTKIDNQNSKKYNTPVLHIYNPQIEDILIVAENAQLCEIIEVGLFSHFNVFCYTNPIKALHDLKSIPKPEVIVADIMMNTMNGIDFFEEIQKDSGYNDIPFIFLTAKTSETAKKEGLAAGAIVFISKPFLVDTLRFQIESIIKNRKRLIKTSEEKAIQLIIEHLNNTHYQSKEKYSQFITKCKSFNLTPLEIEIVGRLLEGLRNAEIHESMNLGYSSVKKHLSAIYDKCGVKSRTQCVMLFNKEPLL
ncbi:MAG: response regulator transcription factor, partial [Spirochaetales bacterium]|nr:response regulator transcription factor [Spirochaetales bacterium]